MKNLIFFLTLSLILCQNAMAQFTLEQLMSGEIKVEELVDAKVSISSLIEEFTLRTSKPTSNALLKPKQNRMRLKALEEEFAQIKSQRKNQKAPKNKHFYGNAKEAMDASQEDVRTYKEILKKAKELLAEHKINASTYEVATSSIHSLAFLHTHNRIIAEEYSMYTESPTYGGHIPIHIEERDVFFELRAGVLFDMLKKAYLFSERFDILDEFFTTGLSRNSGCLEARFGYLSKWHADRQSYFSSLSSLSAEEQTHRLPDTAKSIVTQVIQKNYDEYSDRADQANQRKALALEIAREYEGKYDISGNSITYDLVNSTLKEIYLVNSRSSSPSPRKKASDSTLHNDHNNLMYFDSEIFVPELKVIDLENYENTLL
jgi:hypothetical protein